MQIPVSLPISLPTLNFGYWGLQTLAMLITALLIPKLRITSVFGATLTVVSLALVNSYIWDAALFFKVPDTFTSQAALLFISNGLIFWILVKLLPGIEVDGFLPALIAPVIFTFCSLAIDKYGDQVPWAKLGKQGLVFVEQTRSYFNNPSEKAPPAPHDTH